MKLIKIIALVFLLLSAKSLRANDSLTLAQAYINLSLTDEYFDTLSVTRIYKILPFIENELSTIKDTAFIRKNSSIYHFTYALLYGTQSRFINKIRNDSSRQELLRLKSMLDLAILHFNKAHIEVYNSVEMEKNTYYKLMRFNIHAGSNLYRRLNDLQFRFSYLFNKNIYPDFKRLFYTAKNSEKVFLDSLVYFTSLYNLPLSLAISNSEVKVQKSADYYNSILFIDPQYQTAIGLQVISNFLQFLYLLNEKDASKMSEAEICNMYINWENFIYMLKPEKNDEFFMDDHIIKKDSFFKKEINKDTSDKLYKQLLKKFPYTMKNVKGANGADLPGFDVVRPTKYYFPIPVPFPSAFHYKANFQPGLKSMKQVDNYVANIFNRAGYKGNLHYYYIARPGYAMTTSLEKINKDGSLVSGSTRWSASIGDNNSFSFYDVFKSIFFDTKSDYRMFALVVSVRGARIQSSPTSIGAMQELIKYSYPSLPKDLENEVLPYKTLSAFTYLFRQSDIGEVPMLDVSRRLSMETHLRKSGLGELLK